jgi:hypothetical protein
MTDTQSVLDQMTAGIMGRKQEKATSLTPVGMERPTILDAKGDVFPHDGGIGSQILHSARLIRAELAGIESCLRSIEREAGLTEGGPPVVIHDPKEAARLAVHAEEQAKEASFKERFAKQQVDAQSQVFVVSDEPVPIAPAPVAPGNVTEGWICPVHGHKNLTTLTSRKGRQYKSCVGCDQFERIA